MAKTLLQEVIDSGVKLTPMMKQYSEIKNNYADAFLLFRMGDFYELFFDDAKEAAKILNITLTHRGKLGDIPIPMAGIPHHAASTYIDRITSAGFKAAICEQVEDPKEAKGIVKRAVTQIVSPGIPYDLEKAQANHHYIVATHFENKTYSLIALDFTTGDFFGHQTNLAEEFIDLLLAYSPKEFLTYMGQWDDNSQILDVIDYLGSTKTHLSKEYFALKNNQIYLEKLIPNFKRDEQIKNETSLLSGATAISYYVSSSQIINDLCHIRPFKLIAMEGKMKVSLATLMGLEIIPKHQGVYKDSLLGFMDKTKSAVGSRSLKQFFLSPLCDAKEIKNRQDIILSLLSHDNIEEIRELLSDSRDLERILAKVSTKKVNGSDLVNLANTLEIYLNIEKLTKETPLALLFKLSKKEVTKVKALLKVIRKTINEEIGASLDKGNLIKEGASPERDKLASKRGKVGAKVLKLESKYREETGISKLRIKQNNINGYFIEVSKTQSNKVPKSFTRKQTLVNAERFLTEELGTIEKDVIAAKEKLERLEREIFNSIVENLALIAQSVLEVSSILGLIDVFQSLSYVARNEEFSTPKIKTKQQIIELNQAWHPIIRANIREDFVCHDIRLDQDNFFGLITGPNMAGKTTVMREVAIIQFLAQLGSLVPAKKATLGLCDYLFSRLGASDDILKGQSTFMVEMAETAEIIRHASSRSLIIMDEVGRGTSTYDGLSIAWSLVEHFALQTKALTLFSTHYHELIDVVNELEGAKNLTVETINQKGKVQFLYRLIEEGATQSFGLYVAKLAGLPPSILKRSQKLLKQLEKKELDIDNPQLSLFSESGPAQEESFESPLVIDELKDLDINNMTPVQALEKLDTLKSLLQ